MIMDFIAENGGFLILAPSVFSQCYARGESKKENGEDGVLKDLRECMKHVFVESGRVSRLDRLVKSCLYKWIKMGKAGRCHQSKLHKYMHVSVK